MRPIIADFVERAGWTAGQQFFAVLLSTSSVSGLVDLPWQLAAVSSLGAAVASVLTTFLQYLARLTDLGFWTDQVVRLAKTFVASLLGSVSADLAGILAFDWASAIDLAAVTTLSAFAKGLLARQQTAEGAQPSPSTLTATTYDHAVRRASRWG
jgi:hypothetical protein